MTPQHHQSSSKKRLLSAHQKPKQGPNPGPGSPIVPPDDQLLFPHKKTRDLPNLSDCHGCGLHINHTNPKDRLQTLDSVWRIVLLCKKCIKRVELGQTCPYCFKESAKAECFKCRDCERLIHKDCVAKHGDSSPWSLCKDGLGLGFTVCVDCWVPKMFMKSIRIRRRKKSWKDSKKSRINDSKGPKDAGRIRNDGNCLEGREIVLALRAPRKALTKAEMQRNALELKSGAVNAAANKDKDGKKIAGLERSNSVRGMKCGENRSVSKAVGDVELAFQLHPAMNRSSRILKDSCTLNTSGLGVPKSGDESGSSVEVGKLKTELITYKRRKLKKELKTYKRGCLKRKRFLENGNVGSSVGVVENKSKMDSDPCCIQQGEMKHDHLNDGAVTILVKCDGHDTKQGGICNEKTDRYLLKYSKRLKGCKSRLSRETSIIHGTTQLENQASAPEVPMNCSIESRAFSEASFNSYVVDRQAYTCVGVNQEHNPELNR